MEEIWKDIPGYEGLYKISNKGQVLSLRTGRIRADVRDGNGYRGIQLSDEHHKKHRLKVHRLVALTFLGPPPDNSYQVNHKNLDKADNRVENLEWVTPIENMRHAYKNGRIDFRRPKRSDNRTGYKGVSVKTGGYQVMINGKYLGWFKNLDAAVRCRKKAELLVNANEIPFAGYRNF